MQRAREICQERLDRLRAGDPITHQEIEQEFAELLPYKFKDRFLNARLLHFAIWRASTLDSEQGKELVRCVLDAGADIASKASYTTNKARPDGGCKINQLHAVHIAAAFGCISALEVMAEPGRSNVEELVNTWCFLDGKEFYLPIHEAVFLGQSESVLWLLKKKACASESNLDGYTPLHWLALKGLEPKANLVRVVTSLLQHNASLIDRASSGPKGKIPLQLAAADHSKFPRDSLSLLMPSLQEQYQSHTFISDMCLLASYNTEAAIQLARLLTDSEDAALMSKVKLDAQKKGAADRMANLLVQAPAAAVELLDILMVEPSVQDGGYHPICSRATLRSPMRCEYQADRVDTTLNSCIMLPEWKYDVAEGAPPSWHSRLVPAPDRHEDGREYVDEVKTKAVLLPNMLDIDLFMALACTQPAHISIFDRLPVQGMLYCLWDHVLPAMYFRIVINLVDLFVLAAWGFLSMESEILAAGLLRDVFNIGLRLWAHFQKWYSHQREFNKWMENNRATSSSPSHCRSYREQDRPPSLHALWGRPQAFLTLPLMTTELPLVVAKAVFLGSAVNATAISVDGTMSDCQRGLLTTCAFLQCLKLIYTLTLTNLGKRGPIVLRAFFNGAICENMFIALLVFSSVALACSMWNQEETLSWHMLYLYKAVFFGESESFDKLGLGPVFMIITSFVFIACMLNLITAIFINEYDRLEKDSERHFLQERAKCCCECLLGMPKFLPFASSGSEAMLPMVKVGSVLAVLLLGLLLTPGGTPGLGMLPWRMAIVVLLATWQVRKQSALLVSPWFPARDDGCEGPKKEHFLWICFRARGTGNNQADDSEALGERMTRLESQIGRLEDMMRQHSELLTQVHMRTTR